MPFVLLLTGFARTLSCGGWVFITSNDDHDVHDVLMILYILLNIPWMTGGIAVTSPQDVYSKRLRYVSNGIWICEY